ncbi:MAG: hypothetical protein ACD_26C00065G0004 [uncultured bacterium]|nr:MAG: hypothetical protein ACD_26C00065G0004 [uncultured bacterium]
MISVVNKNELNLVSGGRYDTLYDFLRNADIFSPMGISCSVENGKSTGEIELGGNNYGCGDLVDWLQWKLASEIKHDKRRGKAAENIVRKAKNFCCDTIVENK